MMMLPRKFGFYLYESFPVCISIYIYKEQDYSPRWSFVLWARSRLRRVEWLEDTRTLPIYSELSPNENGQTYHTHSWFRITSRRLRRWLTDSGFMCWDNSWMLWVYIWFVVVQCVVFKWNTSVLIYFFIW